MISNEKDVRIVKTSADGETHTHRVLWSACQRQLEHANKVKKGSWYFYLPAMLMAYFVFEAYINYLGERLAPKLWEDERNHFRKPPYVGTSGKFLKLCEIHNVTFPEKGERPYQSIKTLKNLRDIIAHGKPEKYDLTVQHPDDKNPTIIKSKLNEIITAKNAERTIGDLEVLIDSINEEFYRSVGPGIISEYPLKGPLAMAIGTTELKS
jgi:hypothetical protein